MELLALTLTLALAFVFIFTFVSVATTTTVEGVSRSFTCWSAASALVFPTAVSPSGLITTAVTTVSV